MVRPTILAVVLSAAIGSATAGVKDTAPCRPIDHAMGISCVTGEPRRIAVLDTGELDIAVALGVQPIAATTPYQVSHFPRYLALDESRMHSLGVVQEPDLEKLMKLNPDLILGSRLRHGQLYPLLSSIAPTVFGEDPGVSWVENLRLFGRAMRRDAEAEEWLNRIDERCRRIREQYDAKGQPRLSIVRSKQTHVRLYLTDSFIGTLMNRCGMRRPEAQSGKGFARRLRSPRQIELLDGDIILLSEYAPERGSLIQRWQRSPFWSRLEGRLYPVDDSYWILGVGPLAADRLLDDLEQIIDDYPQH